MRKLGPEIEATLKRVFKSSEKSIEQVGKIFDDFIKSTLDLALAEEFLKNFTLSIRHSPNPEQSLKNFLRFVENSFNKASLYKDLVKYPQMMKILLTIFGYSQYFADILVRDPELFQWLMYSDTIDKFKSKHEHKREISSLLSYTTLSSKLNALRRYKRREILRIGVRDIFGVTSFEETVQSLSDLAEAIIETCLDLAIEHLRKKFSSFPETEFVLIALGKLGGKELNYSSDVDLIFVYNQDGELMTNKGILSHYEIFNHLVSVFINFLSEKTEEGALYRVDFRLRPEGSAGSLAKSLLGYLTYYEIYGKVWERQMLIKARPIAGDVKFGLKFLQMLDHFIYPKSFVEDPVEEITRLKAKIEATSKNEYDVKLRPGGIRDIEFIIQSLQLLNAGNFPQLKEANTLSAIDKLAHFGFLNEKDAKILRENYIYFRRIEHLIQFSQNIQTHTISTDPDTLTWLAKAMRNYEKTKDALSFPESYAPDWKIFKRELDERFEQVRQIYNKIFPVDVKPGFLIMELIGDETSAENFKKFLLDLNFRDLERASRNIEFLAKGKLITGERIFTSAEENEFQKIAPILLNEISKTISPDVTLENFRKIAEGFKYSKLFYELIQENDIRRVLVNISQYSARFSNLLSIKNHLLEQLLSEGNLSSKRNSSEIFEFFRRGEEVNLFDFKFANELRLFVLNIDRLIDIYKLLYELTNQADLIVSYVFEDFLGREFSEDIVIFGLGKYGSAEMNFDSDIDMVILTMKGIGQEKLREISSRCEKFIKKLAEVEIEKLYQVDLRLRPEGRNAPMIVKFDYFENYLFKRAEFWELMAFTRFRYICGNKKLAEEALSLYYDRIANVKFTKSLVDSLVKIRKKMEEMAKGEIDIKVGAGGLVDVEFIAQILQLKHFKELGEIESHTVKALLKLSELRIINEDECKTLTSNYEFYREIEKFLRVSLWRKSNSIPGPGEAQNLEYLSLCLGYRFPDEFVDSIKSRMQKTRRIFEDMINRFIRR